MRRRIAGALLVAGAALLMVIVRVVVSSRGEWREAEARLSQGDREGALDHLGRAARLYAPGNPYSRRALARIAEIARTSDDRALSLLAWREARSAILATRSVYTPHRALLAEANARIATLAAALEPPSVDPGADEAARARWHADRLARDDAPSVGWSLAALAGLALFVGCAIGFFFRGLDERDRLRGRVALAWAAGVGCGLALFLVALARA